MADNNEEITNPLSKYMTPEFLNQANTSEQIQHSIPSSNVPINKLGAIQDMDFEGKNIKEIWDIVKDYSVDDLLGLNYKQKINEREREPQSEGLLTNILMTPFRAANKIGQFGLDIAVPDAAQRLLPFSDEGAYSSYKLKDFPALLSRDAIDSAMYYTGLKSVTGAGKLRTVSQKLTAPLLGANVAAKMAPEDDTLLDVGKKAAIGAVGGTALGPAIGVLSKQAGKFSDFPTKFWNGAKSRLVDPVASRIGRVGEHMGANATSPYAKKIAEGLKFIGENPSPLDWHFPGTPDRFWKKSITEIVKGTSDRLPENVQMDLVRARALRSNIPRKAATIYDDLSTLSTADKLDYTASLMNNTKSIFGSEAVNELLAKTKEILHKTRVPSEWVSQAKESYHNILSMIPANELRNFDAGKLFALNKDGIPYTTPDIINNIKNIISNPNSSEELRNAAIEFSNMTSTIPEFLFKNSREISDNYLIGSLRRRKGKDQVFFTKEEAPKDAILSNFSSLKGEKIYTTRDMEIALQNFDFTRNMSESILRSVMRQFKAAKISFEPAAIMRNIAGNVYLNDLGGLSFSNIPIYARAAKEMYSNTSAFQHYVKETGMGITRMGAEISDFAHRVGKMSSGMDWFLPTKWTDVTGAAKFREMTEVHAKYAKYIYNKEQGMSDTQAILDSLKWTFDYSDVTPLVASLRDSVVPFATWTGKIMPLMLETAVKHPLRVAKWPAMLKGMHELSVITTGMNDQEGADFMKKLPEHLDSYLQILSPVRDERGRLQMIDFSYVLGGFSDYKEWMQENPVGQFMQNPFLNLLYELGNNRNAFGQRIYSDFDPISTQAMKMGGYAWQKFAPSLFPGGTNYNNIYDSYTNDASTLTSAQAIARAVGARITPLDEESINKSFQSRNQAAVNYIGRVLANDLVNAKSQEEINDLLDKARKDVYKKTSDIFNREVAYNKMKIKSINDGRKLAAEKKVKVNF